MNPPSRSHFVGHITLAALAATALIGCGDSSSDKPAGEANYALASVVIDADGGRTTYVQGIASLDDGPFTNRTAIELPGNGSVIAHGGYFYLALTEEPTWVRYGVGASGAIEEVDRLSLLNSGASAIDYGNAIVDDNTAVSVFSNPPIAIVWNPSTMKILGEIDLSSLARPGYELEVWTTVAHNGLVYVPGRWADWNNGKIWPGVSLTILDPKAMRVIGTAEDDRCASAGRVVFDSAGYAYVMADGRTYSIQMFANKNGGTAPANCILRIAPGTTDFEADYYYTVASLTGGLESIGELEAASQDTGIGFAKMFYPDHLPPGVEPTSFDFWNERAHKMWRLDLGDPPTAEDVQGIPFGSIGFGGAPLDGKLYSGESPPDGSTSDVYETDPDTNQARLRFTMAGYFDGLYKLK